MLDSGIVLVPKKQASFADSFARRRSRGEWEIENVVVAAEFLRRGIAKELLRTLIQLAEIEAASAILLEVRESNLAGPPIVRKTRISRGGPPADVLQRSRGGRDSVRASVRPLS